MTSIPENTAAPTEAEQKRRLDSFTLELSLVEGGIQRAQTAIYTSFGVVLPAILSIFVFVAKDTTGIDRSQLATIFIAVVCTSAMWVNSVWIELLQYVRYKYVVLMPKFYDASGRGGDVSMHEFVGTRSSVKWMPAVLFNAGIFVLLVATQASSVKSIVLHSICALFLLFAIAAFFAVLHEVKDVQHAVKSRPSA